MDQFSARELSRLAGFEKPWMLNYLEREDIFVPEISRGKHHGKHRNYTFRDLIILRSINRLLKLGARPKRIKESIDTFRSVFLSDINADYLSEFSKKSSLFIVTGEKVIFCETPEKLIDLVKGGQLAFSFMVDHTKEIAPSVNAALYYMKQIKSGRTRNEVLLQKTASKFSL